MSDAERAPSEPEERSVPAPAPDAHGSAADDVPSAPSVPRDAEAEAADAEAEAKEEERRRNNASAAALTLEIVGDLPHAEIKPPENILFVCKLNPVTRSDDLELIFSRFGKINSCEVIRDKKYAFVEYDDREAAERNVLIDDRRIWVDFSQSVSKLHSVWVKQRMGRGAAPARAPPPRRDRETRGGRAPSRSAPLTHPDMHTENVLVDLDMLRDDPREEYSRSNERYARSDRRDDRREDRPRHDPRDDYRRGSRSDYDRRSRDDDRDRRDHDCRDHDRDRSDRYRRDHDRDRRDRDRRDRDRHDRDRRDCDRHDRDRRDRNTYERDRYGRHRDERRSDRPRYDDGPHSRRYEGLGKDRARSRSP
ncbi:cyp6 [Malassezia furfur]|nr:cyp6 [Malassezia furfur]